MSDTFYSILGVGPGATNDSIEQAYRERAKQWHPDVSSAPDATARFKRLTTAKETLLDETERSRYERLGHEQYVRAQSCCPGWEEQCSAGREDSRSTSSEWGEDSSRAADTSSSGPTRAGTSDDEPTGTADTAGGSTASASQKSSRSTGTTSRTATTGTGTSGRTATTEAGTSSRTGTGTSGRTGTGTSGRTNAGARSTGSASSASTTTASSATARTDGGTNTGTGGAAYGRSTFWQAEKQRSYEPAGSDGVAMHLYGGLRAVGGWLVVHLLFLAIAVGVAAYIYTIAGADGTISLPVALLIAGELTVAVTLTGLHLLSQLYG